MNLTSDESVTFSDETLKKIEASGQTIRDKEFIDCTFDHCIFIETQFEYCIFNDCTFYGCDLSLISVRNCRFIGTKFVKSTVIGVNWTYAAWDRKFLMRAIDFDECAINYNIFIGLKLRKIEIKGCSARGTDFADADVTDGDFQKTDLEEARFLHTDLTRVNFVGAKNYQIVPDLNTITDAKFSLPEAVALLYNMNIEIVEE
jgi:uncharacterized protein YjbI with pentapeptide repeats